MQKALKTILVRELPNCRRRVERMDRTVFPTAGEAVISEVFPVRDKLITFHGVYAGHILSYHFQAETERIADELYDVILRNVGKPVFSLGGQKIQIEIEGPDATDSVLRLNNFISPILYRSG